MSKYIRIGCSYINSIHVRRIQVVRKNNNFNLIANVDGRNHVLESDLPSAALAHECVKYYIDIIHFKKTYDKNNNIKPGECLIDENDTLSLS